MLYAILIYDERSADTSAAPATTEPPRAMSAEYAAYTQQLQSGGALRAGEALQPASTATTIRVRGDETLTTDGPFAETKEALGGFYVIEARDLDEALALAAACPGARFGSVEVRPVVQFLTAG